MKGLDAAPPGLPDEHLAYCLATALHETGATMQPIVENLNYTPPPASGPCGRLASRPRPRPSSSSRTRGPANEVYGGRTGIVGANGDWTYRVRRSPDQQA